MSPFNCAFQPLTHHACKAPFTSLTYHSPPEGVCEAAEVLVDVLLRQVDHEGGEDEAEEPDVDRSNQLLQHSTKQRKTKVRHETPDQTMKGMTNQRLTKRN